jgi:hypothetical protein
MSVPSCSQLGTWRDGHRLRRVTGGRLAAGLFFRYWVASRRVEWHRTGSVGRGRIGRRRPAPAVPAVQQVEDQAPDEERDQPLAARSSPAGVARPLLARPPQVVLGPPPPTHLGSGQLAIPAARAERARSAGRAPAAPRHSEHASLTGRRSHPNSQDMATSGRNRQHDGTHGFTSVRCYLSGSVASGLVHRRSGAQRNSAQPR